MLLIIRVIRVTHAFSRWILRDLEILDATESTLKIEKVGVRLDSMSVTIHINASG